MTPQPPDVRPRAGRLSSAALARIDHAVDPADAAASRRWPGVRLDEQPVHTVLVPAHTASRTTHADWGRRAVAVLDAHVDLLASLADPASLRRVRSTLLTRPVEDLRFDFADTDGRRPVPAQDADARTVGAALVAIAADVDGPFSLGVRTRGLARRERRRALRTIELVLDAAGGVPDGFLVTFPVVAAEQIPVIVTVCDEIERAHGLVPGALRFELELDAPGTLLGAGGVGAELARVDGRCVAVRVGADEWAATVGIPAHARGGGNPLVERARDTVVTLAAPAGLWVCDATPEPAPVGTDAAVREVLAHHHRAVTRALEQGCHQGQDTHPGHLITRWLANARYLRAAAPVALARLHAQRAARPGAPFAAPASARTDAGIVLRGLAVRAFDADEVAEWSPGITLAAVREVYASAR